MSSLRSDFKSVDEYISTFPKDVQIILEKIRQIIIKLAPQAEEKISYQIPAFSVNGKYLIYFAGYKNHIGMYPIHTETPFTNELSKYSSGKASLNFQLKEDIPYELIEKIVKFKLSKIIN